jgi:hypothetical protein
MDGGMDCEVSDSKTCVWDLRPARETAFRALFKTRLKFKLDVISKVFIKHFATDKVFKSLNIAFFIYPTCRRKSRTASLFSRQGIGRPCLCLCLCLCCCRWVALLARHTPAQLPACVYTGVCLLGDHACRAACFVCILAGLPLALVRSPSATDGYPDCEAQHREEAHGPLQPPPLGPLQAP